MQQKNVHFSNNLSKFIQARFIDKFKIAKVQGKLFFSNLFCTIVHILWNLSVGSISLSCTFLFLFHTCNMHVLKLKGIIKKIYVILKLFKKSLRFKFTIFTFIKTKLLQKFLFLSIFFFVEPLLIFCTWWVDKL